MLTLPPSSSMSDKDRMPSYTGKRGARDKWGHCEKLSRNILPSTNGLEGRPQITAARDSQQKIDQNMPIMLPGDMALSNGTQASYSIL